MKRIIIVIFLFCVFGFNVSAQSYEFDSSDSTNLYDSIYSDTGADEIEESAPDEFKDFSSSMGIEASDPFSLKNIFSKGGLDYLLNYFTGYITSPLKSLSIMLLSVMICSLINSLSDEQLGANTTANTAAVLICVAGVMTPVLALFNKSLVVIGSLCSFMTVFIPIFAGILIACLRSSVAIGYQSVMFFATEFVTYISSYIVLPFTNSFLAVSVASGISSSDKLKGLADLLKKIAFIIISGALAIFLAILSIQTVVTGVADNAATKSAKFFISSFVPIIGSSLSEALGSLRTCVGVLRSGVGIYAVIVILFVSLPIVLEIILYKLSLCLLSVVADMFSVSPIKNLSNSVNSALSLVLAVVICVQMMFVFSTAILSLSGGAL